MQMIKKMAAESFFISLFSNFINSLVISFKNSFFVAQGIKFYNWYNDVFLNSKLVKLLFNTTYISRLWYKSYFYRTMMYRIRKISFHIPRASFKFKPAYIGIFMAVVLIIPEKFWSDLFWIPLFFSVVLIYISRNIRERRGTVFVLVNFIILLFMVLVRIIVPFKTVSTLIYLLIGIDFFFLISFSVGTFEDLEDVLEIVFIAALILCGVSIIQNTFTGNSAYASFNNSLTLGSILIIIFPFVFAYSTEFKSNARKIIYGGVTFIFFLNAISATQSRAAFIGLLIELLILFIAYPKYMPFTILLIPLGLNTIIENFHQTWIARTSHGSSVINIINFFKDIWNNGFGVNREEIMNIYNSLNLKNADISSFMIIPDFNISSAYINFIIDIGAILLILFLFYILKLAHSSLIMLFTAEKKYRKFFAAGLAALIGISVSSFFETSLFSPRTLLTYWGILGILRAVRIMSLGVYES